MKIRLCELFAGYGSQAMALERLKRDFPGFDYELVCWSEIERNAIAAHNAVFPEVSALNLGDICKVDWDAAPDFDLMTYSFPCQSISAAGLQHGLTEGSGTRSSLLWECKKAIAAKRPKWLLMENVKALLQKKFAEDFNKWKTWLEEQGYVNFCWVLNAKDYGVPQNRERVFMVSIRRDKNGLEPEYTFPEPFRLEHSLGDMLEQEVDESFFLKPQQMERILSKLNLPIDE